MDGAMVACARRSEAQQAASARLCGALLTPINPAAPVRPPRGGEAGHIALLQRLRQRHAAGSEAPWVLQAYTLPGAPPGSEAAEAQLRGAGAGGQAWPLLLPQETSAIVQQAAVAAAR
jgi:hypothetical protein